MAGGVKTAGFFWTMISRVSYKWSRYLMHWD